MQRFGHRAARTRSNAATVVPHRRSPPPVVARLSKNDVGRQCYPTSLLQQRHQVRTFAGVLATDPPVSPKGKYGIGGHKWQQLEPVRYEEVVQTALEKGLAVLECGQEGGDHALEDAYLKAVENNPELRQQPVTVLTRLGYRSVLPVSASSDDNQHASALFLANDVKVEEVALHKDKRKDEEEPGKGPQLTIVHNISADYVKTFLHDCPFLRLRKQDLPISVVPLIHNPEVQAVDMLKDTPEARQERIQERLAVSFLALEQKVGEGVLAGYGIVSNGLCLPREHPMHLAEETVFAAAEQAKAKLQHDLHLSVIQIPANLIETIGIDVARSLHERALQKSAIPHMKVNVMRPLTCYPDQGTGTGLPFILADYQLPATLDKNDPKVWSNEMDGPPQAYEVALKHAMAHFDATEILELKEQGHELNTNQRETLDGCKLLQSMLHDVDQGLDNVRSFAAHEQQLYEKIIPLIHDTFEGYDEETAQVLHTFFATYSMAVRYSIAKNTRALLKRGEKGSNIAQYDIPDDMRLQEFALRYLLREPAIDKIMIGCSRPEQIAEDLNIAAKVLSETVGKATEASEEGAGKAASQ